MFFALAIAVDFCRKFTKFGRQTAAGDPLYLRRLSGSWGRGAGLVMSILVKTIAGALGEARWVVAP
ncbi:MAG: hypothetical protein ACLFVO_09155 [Chloroflexaceae bacterium]